MITNVCVRKILQNENARTELFKKIASNHEYMTEFMQIAMNEEHGKMMMMQNKDMMAMMMQNQEAMMNMMKENPAMMQGMMQNMMAMGKEDSAMAGNMAGMMMQNPSMMMNMMNMMHQKGMMSKECMDEAMAKMKNMQGMGNGHM